MAAYSIDLRQRILSAWQNKEGSQRELAKRFQVSLSFIRDFLRRYRETGEIAAKPQGGDRRSKLNDIEQELLKGNGDKAKRYLFARNSRSNKRAYRNRCKHIKFIPHS